jgi:glucan phosphoethanolaminetransferase (alkaline phosphatase superfamily)
VNTPEVYLPQSYIFGLMKYRLILIFVALSLLMICLWQHFFHLPGILIAYHLAVMVPLHIVCLSLIALGYRGVPTRWYSVLKIGSWGLMVSFFYLLIFGSMHFWGDIITIKILSTYFHSFSSFLHSMPFSYSELVAAILLFISLPYLIAFLLVRQIESALIDLGDALISHSRIILALGVLLLLSSPLVMRAKRVIHMGGEPLMVMLFDHMWGVTDSPLFSQRRIRVGFEDNKLRRQYAADHSPTRSGRNVVLIIVDALRADHLSAYGYGRETSPFIDSLVASHRVAKVDRCYSTCACTLCGVTSILLSRTWNDCAVNGFNIVGLLRDRGYHTYALISGAHHEWYNMAKFYSDDCSYFDGKDSRKYYFKDDRVLLEGLDRIGPYADTASFFYFHLQSTHETGLLQDRYAVYKPFKKSITTQGMNGQAAINEYDDKVLQADDMIRQIFAALDQKGYLRNSTVIITADHGQGLGEHGVSGHVDWLYDPQISVPLLIYDDSLSLYHNLTFARHIDIAPTIVDRLHLPLPESWMGSSLLTDLPAPYSYHETGQNGLETGQAKYMIVCYEDSEVMQYKPVPRAIYKYIFTEGFRREELYELLSDPGEINDLSTIKKQILDQMRAKAKEQIKAKFGND